MIDGWQGTQEKSRYQGEIQFVMSMRQNDWQNSLCNVMIYREIDTISTLNCKDWKLIDIGYEI